MGDKNETVRLQDGTLVRHRIQGYQGRIEGTTAIKACFTRRGALLAMPTAKEAFQYRVVVTGEAMRHIAPAEDLEVLEEEKRIDVSCFSCHSTFRTKPGLSDKPGGRCQCGGWICPSCLACQDASAESSKTGNSPCVKQRQRLVRRLANEKKGKALRTEA
jgi:hypothetical protein